MMETDLKQEQNKIACCFLTHNHPEVVKDVLENARTDYAAHGIDMIFCDDSSDLKTREIVEQYIGQGASNVYYMDAACAENGNGKYFLAIKKQFLPHKYDYIWPCKDRVYYRGKILDSLVASCDQGYDAVLMLNPGDKMDLDWPVYKTEYTDSVELFSHFGQMTTNWEGMVYRADTMLDLPDWKPMEEKYHLGPYNSFNQMLFFFARLAEMSQYRIKLLFAQNDQLIYSSFAKSGWRSLIFELWIDKWISAVYSLPSVYDPYKMQVIKAETNLPVLFGGMGSLIGLYSEGILTKEVFERYRSSWTNISDVPVSHMDMLLNDQLQELFLQIFDEFNQAFAAHDLDRTYSLFVGNFWMEELIGKEDFSILNEAYYYYRFLRINHSSTECFSHVTDYHQFIEAYQNK